MSKGNRETRETGEQEYHGTRGSWDHGIMGTKEQDKQREQGNKGNRAKRKWE